MKLRDARHRTHRIERQDAIKVEDTREVCPNCMGSGEVVREDGSDHQVEAVCLECHGCGWLV